MHRPTAISKRQPASAVAPRTHIAPARGVPIRRPSPARLPSAACQAHARPATRRAANRREAAMRSVAFPSDRAWPCASLFSSSFVRSCARWPPALAGLIPDPRLPLLAGAARHHGLRVAGHDRRLLDGPRPRPLPGKSDPIRQSDARSPLG